ncbi:hypothetical protein PFICI_14748 [Pestalotiopsis fici W106-1]|uniref:Transcription factor domain-containing protein n=1 Tax=Pestalotiopsis fici (strain W106-1 / CGMCC3.15140) TaxID=1229662 RepID=W3WKY4_PESFW|nr:uncharacterized protein PFICI_14748 [Pestalotiopsis fici W106-1]ETS73802.1 hypothetical protein PFICI_14748 [Pestalotiopsis fici W106-1]
MDAAQKSKLRRAQHASKSKTSQKSSRPRGRPPRNTFCDDDVEAIHYLQGNIQSLDDKIRDLNQLVLSELAIRRKLNQAEDAASSSRAMITPAPSPETESDSTEDEPEKDFSKLDPIVITDSSLRTADVPIKAALVEKFVDSYGPPKESDSESKFWIHEGRPWVLWRVGAEQCASSELLQSAYLAVSAAYAGLIYQDKRLIRAGAQSYAYVLRSLQKALNYPEAGKSDAVLMTVGLCMNYEGRLSRDAKAGYTVHVAGVLRLFEYRGPELHRSGLAHYFFVDARLYCTWCAIRARRPTFLAKKEWKTVPWTLGTTSKDMMQYLFDDMLEIPNMLWYVDQCRGLKEKSTKVELYDKACSIAAKVKAGLERWKSTWLDPVIWRKPHEKNLRQMDPTLPVFRYPNPENPDEILEPPDMVYPNGALLAAVMNYHAALLIVNDAIRELEGRTEDAASVASAHEICRSMNYFLVNLPASMLGRVAQACVVAYDLYPEGGIERDYMAKAYDALVGGTWRRFEDFLDEFSILRRHG